METKRDPTLNQIGHMLFLGLLFSILYCGKSRRCLAICFGAMQTPFDNVCFPLELGSLNDPCFFSIGIYLTDSSESSALVMVGQFSNQLWRIRRSSLLIVIHSQCKTGLCTYHEPKHKHNLIINSYTVFTRRRNHVRCPARQESEEGTVHLSQ
jgi:hypothetical protein